MVAHLLVLALTVSQQTALDSLMEAHRLEGSGPGMVVAAARGDLNGDGRDDTAAVFTYVIGESRNRAGVQFLVVLLDTPSAVRYVGPRVIGVKGERLVEHVTIRRDTILLSGLQYTIADPQCCPSATYEQRVVVAGDRFVELGGEWIAAGQDTRLRLTFVPDTPEFDDAAAEYTAIWAADGRRIVEALESHTGLRFEESQIRVTVLETASSSGFGDRPMRMRASYMASTKRATLIHELGHRLHGRFVTRRNEDHPYLFLYLYDVWVELYGKEFADAEVAVESRRRGIYDYESAWREALAMTADERLARWQEFLRSRDR